MKTHSVRALAIVASISVLLALAIGQSAAGASAVPRPAPLGGTPTVVPLDMSGCSNSVCISIQSFNGSGTDVLTAEVTDKSESCLPVGSQVYLLYGSSPSHASVWKVFTINTTYNCEWGATFFIYQNLKSGYWLCGELSALPGKPCGQILS